MVTYLKSKNCVANFENSAVEELRCVFLTWNSDLGLRNRTGFTIRLYDTVPKAPHVDKWMVGLFLVFRFIWQKNAAKPGHFFLALTFVQQEYAAKILQVYIIAVRT